MRFCSFCVAACVIAAICEPACAQDAAANRPPENCLAKPQTDGQDQPEDSQNDQTAPPSLTEKLDPCDGILKPPAVGDQEMTLRPPAGGEMPVIRPHDLPQQEPNSQ